MFEIKKKLVYELGTIVRMRTKVFSGGRNPNLGLEVQKGSTGREQDRRRSYWGRTKVDIVMIEFHFSVV